MKHRYAWIVYGAGVIILVAGTITYAWMCRTPRLNTPPAGGRLSDSQAGYDVIFYDLDLEVRPSEHTIAGSVSIVFRAVTDRLPVVDLDLINTFKVERVMDENGKELAYRHTRHNLSVTLAAPLEKDSVLSFTVYYEGPPQEAVNPPWSSGFVWAADDRGDDWIGVTCQGTGGKIWFPCKTHPSDKPDSAAINITVPSPYYCASNGILRNVTIPRSGFRKFHWITRYPITNYNITLNIAKYEIIQREYRTAHNLIIPVFFYVLPQAGNGAGELLDMVVDMLSVYRRYFGEYPFAREKIGIVQTRYPGMEHQTIIGYGNRYRYRTFEGEPYDGVLLHELAHEWWGNKVSVRDWADYWINEGFATYSEALFYREKWGEPGYHRYMNRLRKRIRNHAPILPDRNTTTRNAYSTDLYAKGAFVLHSLRYIMKDSLFFKTIYEFATDPAYSYRSTVSTGGFIALVNRNARKDYTPFFMFYLRSTHLFEVHIAYLSENNYRITIPNIDFSVPMDVDTDEGTRRMLLERAPVRVHSKIVPVVDSKGWFLKRVIAPAPPHEPVDARTDETRMT